MITAILEQFLNSTCTLMGHTTSEVSYSIGRTGWTIYPSKRASVKLMHCNLNVCLDKKQSIMHHMCTVAECVLLHFKHVCTYTCTIINMNNHIKDINAAN